MNFVSFAEQHGLIIRGLVEGRWTRVPTSDHPHKKNGAYIYEVDSGAVQNWAIHEKPLSWRGDTIVSYADMRRKKVVMDKETAEKNRQAAKKAARMLKDAKKEPHPYLTKKGFPDEKAWVWHNLMLIPMRVGGSLVGCQIIDSEGTKKFMSGQRTKLATAVFDNKGLNILCEGYATAMSVRRALRAVRTRYRIIVCFSAANILAVAKEHADGFVVADNDPTGLSVAKKSGLPFWQSDVEGEDFNDAEIRMGAQAAGESLLNVIGLREVGQH